MYSEIIAAGKYLPEKRVLNDDLKEWMDTSDEWIRTRTGIEERRIATNENTSDLCIQAARSLLDTSNVTPDEIGFIIVATMTPDFQSPSVACLVQDAIGATNSYAFDLSAACSGFVYALSTAEKLLTGSDYSYGLVIGGETMSKVVDWDDRSTAVLFGDGAGAVLEENNLETWNFSRKSTCRWRRRAVFNVWVFASQKSVSNWRRRVQAILFNHGWKSHL